MTRRDFIKTVGAATAATTTAALSKVGGAAPAQTRRPNFLIILADDMGFSDIGPYGGEIETPNLDRLAGQGVRFTQAYSAARCCPSRASLLTGLYPHQAGMGDMVSRLDKPRPEGPYQGYLNERCVTLAEALRSSGYRTYMSGKWHVGEQPPHWPRRRGFDRYYGLISGASSYFEILDEGKGTRTMARDDEKVHPEGDRFYMTDAFSDFAVQCLEDHGSSEEPFFLYLAYTAPHWPLHAWPEEIQKYEGRYLKGWDRLREERYERLLNLGIIKREWRLSPRDPDVPAWDSIQNKSEWDRLMAVYAAMVDRMDQGIGRVLDALRKIRAEENTWIIFLSDNGGCHEDVAGRKLNSPGTRPGEKGSFVAYKRPWANASNTPFRMFKHWVQEGGIATPLIARGPGLVPQPGALTSHVAHITDIMPTCLELASGAYPKEFEGRRITPAAGRSLAPILKGQPAEPREWLYWEHEGNRAVRQGAWKLVASKDEDWGLFNLEEDRTELNNLVAQEKDRAHSMNAAYEAWCGQTGV